MANIWSFDVFWLLVHVLVGAELANQSEQNGENAKNVKNVKTRQAHARQADTRTKVE